MIIKRIAAICKAAGRVRLYDAENGEQWLGDGGAVYSMGGLPHMDMDSVCYVLDLTAKERDKLSIRAEFLPDTFNWEDEDETEQPVTIPELTIQYGSRELVPVSTSAGVLLINPVYFKPLQDIRNGLEFFERTTPDGGLTYLVAKSGWVLRAVILPLRADAYPGLAETLERVAQGLAQAAQSKASRSGAAPDGMQFEIDPETGEVLED